ncbi:hypothetical protein ZIOFF_064693 [Zingiber officinale]|uniref:RNA polymerase sigma-70 domain-containing protein n=1 Tax=Zingiber officinale TaxID=94328 RepID=A0A8J5KCR0_ZINOF|nr:hypothetical protein ZIOFF_064693 [Zingiber officinale]
MEPASVKSFHFRVNPELLKSDLSGYLRGFVSENLLTHAEVVNLSKKIKAEKLAMSNVRLVMSIAQKYDNMGTTMADLAQAGLISLLRGIEKFDSSKRFKISTYKLAESLNMAQKKVRNATKLDSNSEEANFKLFKLQTVIKVLSLDREAFPSLNGIPGETLHSDEVDKLLNATLRERERDIIRLYHGIDSECHTWEEIGKQFGLSRERVRQVGLVSMEKLKHVARRRRLEVMLMNH